MLGLIVIGKYLADSHSGFARANPYCAMLYFTANLAMRVRVVST